MRSVWVYQFHWRPTLFEDMTDREQEVLAQHDQYIESLYARGDVVLAGAVTDPPRGLVFFTASDESAARAIMAADPCVTAGIVEATMHRFGAGYVGPGPGYNHLRNEDTPVESS